MSEWTPGPWDAEKLSRVARENERPWVGRLSEHRYAALSCGETQAEATANAHLIAAAPDLYEALERMVATYADMQDGNGEPCPDVIAARTAIAKARGETQ